MFVYCTSWLRYSEPAAFRRIRTARCVARFPEIYALLEANEVSLSTIARVSQVLTASNRDALLARIRGRSRREVEAIVAEFEPCMKVRDVLRPVVVRVPDTVDSLRLSSRPHDLPSGETVATGASLLGMTVERADVERACEKSTYLRREGDSHPPLSTEKGVQLKFIASEAFHRKLEKIKTLAWHRLPANASLEQVFELVMDEFIGQHDPRARQHRRERRASAKSNPKKAPSKAQRAEGHSRYVPGPVKDNVFVRDNAQCTFVGADGRRCGETRNLHIDHIIPRTRNGSSDESNLRLLCAPHNALEAERMLGKRLMRRYHR
jgi:5-methylcytosine-specific restriction endonuclease McrA